MPKADKLEHAKRVEEVRQLILSGGETTHIVQTVSEKWLISTRQGWNYIRSARALILQAVQPSREYLLAEHIAVRRDIRERAKRSNDYRAEMLAAKDEAELFGLYPAKALELSGGLDIAMKGYVGINPDEWPSKPEESNSAGANG